MFGGERFEVRRSALQTPPPIAQAEISDGVVLRWRRTSFNAGTATSITTEQRWRKVSAIVFATPKIGTGTPSMSCFETGSRATDESDLASQLRDLYLRKSRCSLSPSAS